jgi:hypothetical protein
VVKILYDVVLAVSPGGRFALQLSIARRGCGVLDMKLAGFLLLLAGWVIVLSSVILLRSAPSQAAFVLAGIGVEAFGLALVIRSHLVLRGERS